MSNQPSQGPDYQRSGSSPWPGYQPPPQNQGPSYGQPQYGQSQYNPGQYGQGQYNNAQYGQPQYFGQPYYGRAVEPKTLSIASMVCGIASVIMGWLLLPQFAAIITGHLALRREPSGKGMSITGLVLGYLCLLGYGAIWLLFIIGLAVAATTGSNTGTF
ncbi:DUF4190 domain-containing protein [Arthrobacter sp. FW306-05-C]|uniref:DUF4190 domain-containing protein n=1 Tax=Arthrobacter TaxID=1663 RepID=UPI001EF0B61D|nr:MULTISPECIES: DUF4190 domain-containing protein [Arthrobacter]MDP9987132.1 hypothetical protein [Arthrobacter oryzae]UKA67029.1 DUF4190 domain-containing protein [Arthrobacter sp. FW306-05-C]UKA71503.1 DUF4190 domain-containing protein [Arthrobacter sp. FW306-06-A]UKA75664.1 DUF4190 domain-containing protein [Arthrobacter sp. FW306-07-I]